MADMSLGLATAPILYAAENAPEIKKIVKRRFKKEVRDDPCFVLECKSALFYCLCHRCCCRCCVGCCLCLTHICVEAALKGL